MRYTIALDQATVDTLDGVRRKRNISNYERAGAASPGEAAEVYSIAVTLRRQVIDWLLRYHFRLLSAR